MWTSKLTIIWRVSDPATVICLHSPDGMGAWPTLWKSSCCQSKHCKMGDLSITEDKQSSKSKALRWAVFSGDNPIFVLQIQQVGWVLAYFICCWWRFEHVHFCLFTQQNPPDPRRVPKTENDTLKNNSQNVLRSILQCVPPALQSIFRYITYKRLEGTMLVKVILQWVS